MGDLRAMTLDYESSSREVAQLGSAQRSGR
jgi:hypothetical protein